MLRFWVKSVNLLICKVPDSQEGFGRALWKHCLDVWSVSEAR